jgi:EAL domain-containing protein (putative c-di-GMP-specific phosphodiesterase class I)
VARIGGDEFVVLLESLDDHEPTLKMMASVVANKILQVLNEPYQLAEHEFRTTVSIGVALYINHNLSCEDLLKHADIAMYQAKQDGRNKVCYFDLSMLKAIKDRIAVEADLKLAIQYKQFSLFYQVQVNHDGIAVGAEALIRWKSPQRGMLLPLQFIPLAEETDLIITIGHWVLESACIQLMHWKKNPLTKHLTLSINVSAKQFRQVNFADQVNVMLAQYGVNPGMLILEITESILLDSFEEIIATMILLKKIGVQISLDDFGIGYSSLQYLKRLPIQQLKIDQSFVRDIVDDNNDLAIVSTIIAMAQHMGMPVIAEGVETVEQQKILFTKGCKNYQGYLFGKPLPIEQFEAALNEVCLN